MLQQHRRCTRDDVATLHSSGLVCCKAATCGDMFLQIALIRLYQRFTLKLAPGQLPLAVHTNLTMAPTHGVKVLVQRRL